MHGEICHHETECCSTHKTKEFGIHPRQSIDSILILLICFTKNTQVSFSIMAIPTISISDQCSFSHLVLLLSFSLYLLLLLLPTPFQLLHFHIKLRHFHARHHCNKLIESKWLFHLGIAHNTCSWQTFLYYSRICM